jgi:hypothetical protein
MPEDVARVVVFFADEDSGFVTGESLTVDGGMLASGPLAGLADPVGGLDAVVGVNRGMTGFETIVRRRL